jgi:hypothetical protein
VDGEADDELEVDEEDETSEPFLPVLPNIPKLEVQQPEREEELIVTTSTPSLPPEFLLSIRNVGVFNSLKDSLIIYNLVLMDGCPSMNE